MRWAPALTILFLACSLVLGVVALTDSVRDPLMDVAFFVAVVSFLGLFVRMLMSEADKTITRQRLHERCAGRYLDRATGGADGAPLPCRHAQCRRRLADQLRRTR